MRSGSVCLSRVPPARLETWRGWSEMLSGSVCGSLPDLGPDHAGELGGHRLDARGVRALDHHAGERLGARVADQHAADAVHLRLERAHALAEAGDGLDRRLAAHADV